MQRIGSSGSSASSLCWRWSPRHAAAATTKSRWNHDGDHRRRRDGGHREHGCVVGVRGEHRCRPGIDREGAGLRGAVGRGQLEHHPGLRGAGFPRSRPGHDRQGDGVLGQATECDTGHRRRQSSWATPTAAGVERLACGQPHGGHPPGAHVRGDRQRSMFHRRRVQPGPGGSANDIRFLIQAGVDFIIGYPDREWRSPMPSRKPRTPGSRTSRISAGWVGLPDQEGALVPGDGLPDRRRRGPVCPRRELRGGHERRRGVRRGGRPRRDPGQRSVPRLATVRHLGPRKRGRAGQSAGQREQHDRRHQLVSAGDPRCVIRDC